LKRNKVNPHLTYLSYFHRVNQFLILKLKSNGIDKTNEVYSKVQRPASSPTLLKVVLKPTPPIVKQTNTPTSRIIQNFNFEDAPIQLSGFIFIFKFRQ
jgi:hypothetical protein